MSVSFFPLLTMIARTGRARVVSHIQSVMIVTKARDNQLTRLTRELALWLMLTPRNGKDRGLIVYAWPLIGFISQSHADPLLQPATSIRNFANPNALTLQGSSVNIPSSCDLCRIGAIREQPRPPRSQRIPAHYARTAHRHPHEQVLSRL